MYHPVKIRYNVLLQGNLRPSGSNSDRALTTLIIVVDTRPPGQSCPGLARALQTLCLGLREGSLGYLLSSPRLLPN
jgi:hypothetical protein